MMKHMLTGCWIIVMSLCLTAGSVQTVHAKPKTAASPKEIEKIVSRFSERMERISKEADRGQTSQSNLQQMSRDMATTSRMLVMISQMIRQGQLTTTPIFSHRQLVELRAMLNKLGE